MVHQGGDWATGHSLLVVPNVIIEPSRTVAPPITGPYGAQISNATEPSFVAKILKK